MAIRVFSFYLKCFSIVNMAFMEFLFIIVVYLALPRLSGQTMFSYSNRINRSQI